MHYSGTSNGQKSQHLLTILRGLRVIQHDVEGDEGKTESYPITMFLQIKKILKNSKRFVLWGGDGVNYSRIFSFLQKFLELNPSAQREVSAHVFRCSQKLKYICLFALFVLNFFLQVSFVIPECNLKDAPSVKFHYFPSILFSVEGTSRTYNVDADSTVRISLVAVFVRAIINVFRKRLTF